MIGEQFCVGVGERQTSLFEPGSWCGCRHGNWTRLPSVSFMSATRDH